MDAVTYSTARKQFVTTMERVCNNHEPIIITRKNARAVVMMSLEDYNAIEETAYLLRNPANAARLRDSLQQYKKKKKIKRKLIEE